MRLGEDAAFIRSLKVSGRLSAFRFSRPKSGAETPEDVNWPPGQSVGSVKQIWRSGKDLDAVIAADTADNDPPRIKTSQSSVLEVVSAAAEPKRVSRT